MRKIELQVLFIIHLCPLLNASFIDTILWASKNSKIRNFKSIYPANERVNIEKGVGTLFQVTKRYGGKNQCSLPFISARRQAGNIQFLRAHFMADKTHESEVHM